METGRVLDEGTLKPGWQLDALIAEKVMGIDFENIHGPFRPKYSTDISDAWDVVEKIKNLKPDHSFDLEFNGNGWMADFVFHDYGFNNNGKLVETAPHAICLAALEAIGVLK